MLQTTNNLAYFLTKYKFLLLAICITTFIIACQKTESNQSDKKAKFTLLENRNGSACTLAPDPLCDTFSRYNIPYVVEGCILLVSYKVQICPGPLGCKKFNISGFDFTYSKSSACNKLKNKIGGDILVGGLTQFYQTYNTFYSNLTKMIEVYEIQQYLNANPGTSGCVFPIEWLERDCLRYCFGYDDEGSPTLTEEKCGDGCCFRSTTYTISGGIPTPGTPVINEGLPCSDITTGCPGTCHPACARL